MVNITNYDVIFEDLSILCNLETLILHTLIFSVMFWIFVPLSNFSLYQHYGKWGSTVPKSFPHQLLCLMQKFWPWNRAQNDLRACKNTDCCPPTTPEFLIQWSLGICVSNKISGDLLLLAREPFWELQETAEPIFAPLYPLLLQVPSHFCSVLESTTCTCMCEERSLPDFADPRQVPAAAFSLHRERQTTSIPRTADLRLCVSSEKYIQAADSLGQT